LLNSFTQKIVWLNSIPKDQIEVATNQSRPETAFLLSNLLLLAEDIEQGQTPQYEAIFGNIERIYGSKAQSKQSLFINEMVKHLSIFIERKYIATNYVIENQVFPLVILPKHENQSAMVVRIDGKLSKGKTFNPGWERRILSDLQLPVISTWSYNWWRDAKDAAFRIAQEVFAYDKQFEKKEESIEEITEA
jgi:hypothetical protein